jgi:hypothetical protein
MEELQLEHTSGKWSLKTVLLYNGNNLAFIPLAHAVHRKKRTRTCRFCCKKYAMKNTGGIYVLT